MARGRAPPGPRCDKQDHEEYTTLAQSCDLVGDLGPHFLHLHNEGVKQALSLGGSVMQNAWITQPGL